MERKHQTERDVCWSAGDFDLHPTGMLFTELSTHVLLQIYGYLDLVDSINLGETCTRLRDVAQLHYNRFKMFDLGDYSKYHKYTKRDNRIDETTVLKHIGPFISTLVTRLDAKTIGSDVSTSIMTYCVNVKALKIIEGSLEPSYNPFSVYSEWLRKLSLTKISVSIRDLFLIDLTETTTLEELHMHYCLDYGYKFTVDYGRIADILDKNCNISSLCIRLDEHCPYEIFKKLKNLKRLKLYHCNGAHLKEISANLEMTALETVQLDFDVVYEVDGLNEFLQKLSENALHLKDLYIFPKDIVDSNTLPSIQLLNLTSLYLDEDHLYKDIPKMQPNLKHLKLELVLRGGSDLDSKFEKITFLIKNLEKLEILHLRYFKRCKIRSTVNHFLKESVLCRIFDHCSINRPTVTLRFFKIYEPACCLQLELDFMARKWTWTLANKFRCFMEHMSTVKTFRDYFDVQRLSGTVSDLNSVRDEVVKWVDNFYWFNVVNQRPYDYI